MNGWMNGWMFSEFVLTNLTDLNFKSSPCLACHCNMTTFSTKQ